jgi:short subunit dehydrogenase-like uncharacterized protein
LRVPVERDGKKLPKASTIEFVLLLLVGIPFWALVLVPVLVIYQVLWKILFCNLVLRKSSSSSSEATLKSVIPSPDTVAPREQRPYDVVILGATGFTGTMAVEYLLTQYRNNTDGDSSSSQHPIRFAMAGRSLAKLKALQAKLEQEFKSKQQQPSTNDTATSSLVDIIVVDTMVPAQVISMIQTTQVVVNFVGPYQLHGGSVVMEACAKYGTHYVDITGEVDWVKEMLTWSPQNDGITLHDVAQRTSAKLINFCGHDCIPWDLTVFKLEELLQRHNADEELVRVQCWDELYSSPSGGTVATIVASVGNKDLLQLQREMSSPPESDAFLKLPNGTTSSARLQEDAQWWIGKTSPSSSPSLSPTYSYTGPFVMAPINAQLVKRSHVLRSLVQAKGAVLSYREVAVYADFQTAFCTTFKIVLSFCFLLLSGIPPVDYILQKVMLKSGDGPSRASQMRHYLFLVGRGTGSRGTVVETAMYFRKDPGYMDTSRMAVESALCLVVPESLAMIPSQTTGGFWTPSTGLGNELLDRLVKTGTTFDSQLISEGN